MSHMQRLSLLCALAALGALPARAAAQGEGTITGRVVDAATGQPVPTAQINIVGTTLGALTNDNGTFTVPRVPAGAVNVRAARIGYRPATKPATVTASDTVTVSFQLSATSVQLDQVVVTGTAGNQVRRAQPAVVADVDVNDLVQHAPVTSVADVLQGRVAGVSLERSSGTSGTSQSIRIRGASSISLSNEPLIFIDGVRADSRNLTTGRGNAGGCSGCDLGGQATSRLNDIDPSEIESIEIVKGPAAATLYGADASAGVIQIITKRGKINSGKLQQNVRLEYDAIDPNYTPPDNYAACTASLVAPDSPNPLCAEKEVGTIIHDNPLVREDVFRTGSMRGIGWSGHGGGSNYGYFAAANFSNEDGTLPNNSLDHKDGRFNFHFQPGSKVVIDAGYAGIWTKTKLPDQGNNPIGFGGALISNPLTFGGPNNGWFGAHRDKAAISAIDNQIQNVRNTPTLEVRYTPTDWFSNRLTVGADISRSNTLRLIPKNDLGSYLGLDNTGNVKETRYADDQYTFDYLGNIKTGLFGVRNWASDVSFGVQIIDQKHEYVWADGIGLATNSAHSVSAAASQTGGQFLQEQHSVGYIGQWQVAWADRLYLQFGARIDQNSGFGENVKTFVLPKAGVSYVISEEPFWQQSLPWVSTLRLRAAYGTTGRAPTAGAAAQTYDACPYIAGGSESPGVCLLNPGNPDLRPEKGTEFEGGIDAGFLNDKFGAEVTYYRKTTTDLLLQRPAPPSSGYLQSPYDNIGKVLNEGLEVSLRAQLLDRESLGWDANLIFNTLHNELLSLGDIEPFGTGQRYEAGQPLGAFWGYKVESIDVANNKAIVSNDREFLGNLLPTFEGSFATTFTIHRNVRLSGHLAWKTGYKVNNNTQSFRERTVANALTRVDTTALPKEERLRRFGPYFTEDGDPINTSQVADPYVQDGDFLRLREVSLAFTIPDRYVTLFRASGATLTFAGQNLALWTKYPGPDPEIHSNIITTQFDQSDFLTFPPTRRYVVKLSLQF
ncbi:MAG TPA: SusC/RagA family TonB-linked outer membrane protein [Gemmatimonadaceae bacterium]|nr:SusC/RagA family TonB-linked outer membrane protein [Gemmatimonadaceae bacterium]